MAGIDHIPMAAATWPDRCESGQQRRQEKPAAGQHDKRSLVPVPVS